MHFPVGKDMKVKSWWKRDNGMTRWIMEDTGKSKTTEKLIRRDKTQHGYHYFSLSVEVKEEKYPLQCQSTRGDTRRKLVFKSAAVKNLRQTGNKVNRRDSASGQGQTREPDNLNLFFTCRERQRQKWGGRNSRWPWQEQHRYLHTHRLSASFIRF